MKRTLGACGAFALMLATAYPARALTLSPTSCPDVGYICSLLVTGANPLTGAANDGTPSSVIGFLFFDGTGKVTANLGINANGTIHNVSDGVGTCTSGTDTKPGSITVTTPAGQMTFDFVVARSAASINLLFSNNSAGPNPSHVSLGICHASAAG